MDLSYFSIQAIRKDFIALLAEEFFKQNSSDSFNSIAWWLISDMGGMAGEW